MRAWLDEAVALVVTDDVVCPTCCAASLSATAAVEARCDSCGAEFDEETLTALAEALAGDGDLRGPELAGAVAAMYPSGRAVPGR